MQCCRGYKRYVSCTDNCEAITLAVGNFVVSQTHFIAVGTSFARQGNFIVSQTHFIAVGTSMSAK
ncbi:MAG: hypothetical protein ACI4GC_08695 [Acutalibacteraceae bacterium]